MPNNLVVYLMSGPAHVPYVTVSIWSLRKSGYTGPITVFAWPESVGFMRALERDDRLNIWVSEREPKLRRKDGMGGNAQGLDRIDLVRSLEADVVAYFDADSSIHGDITPMFDAAARSGYCATQWCDWVSNNGKTRGRIHGLLDIEGIPGDLVQQVLTHRWPSLNCGVFAAKPDSPLLTPWYEWCKLCKGLFIADERTQHLLMASYPDKMTVLLGGAFNCSPKFQPGSLRDEDVVVYHYHGDSNTRPNKSQRGWDLWRPMWFECLEKNIGRIRSDWRDMGNKYLPKVMKDLEVPCE